MDGVRNEKRQRAINLLAQIKDEYDSKLTSLGVNQISTNREEYAKTIFRIPGYKNRTARDKERNEFLEEEAKRRNS